MTKPDLEGERSRTHFVDQEFDLAYPTGIEKHYWTVARNRIIEGEIRKIAVASPRILEVGCGKGIVVRHLRERGFDCHGVELAEVAPLEEVADVVDTATDAADLPAEARSAVDVLLLLDVIEHLPEPEDFLRRLLESFPAVSTLLVTVPARPELWSNYDEAYGHMRRYDRPLLRHTIETAGGRVEHISYFFRFLYPPARLLLATRRERSVEIRAPGPGVRWLHSLAASLLLLDYHALPRALPGTSLICRARVRGS